MRPKACLVANTSWYIYNFRLPLLQDLKENGFDVVVMAPRDKFTERLESLGFNLVEWKLIRKSINPFAEISAIIELARLYRSCNCDIYHHFTIKACIYGTIAAKLTKRYRVVNSITGLGHLFVSNKKRTRALRGAISPLYKKVLSAKRAVNIFQNKDDADLMIRDGMTRGEQAKLIYGSGVDVNYFSAAAGREKLSEIKEGGEIVILFPSRVIKEKGIQEVVEAMHMLEEAEFCFKLRIAGDIDSGNRSSLSRDCLELLAKNDRIELMGHCDNMREVYADAHIVLLPSWREGLSRTLIEAAAMEKPIITSDVPGCRDVVEHGKNGLLIKMGCSHSISMAILLMARNGAWADGLGRNARTRVISEFEVSLVNKRTIDEYNELLDHDRFRSKG